MNDIAKIGYHLGISGKVKRDTIHRLIYYITEVPSSSELSSQAEDLIIRIGLSQGEGFHLPCDIIDNKMNALMFVQALNNGNIEMNEKSKANTLNL